jgi:hypothetical protein
LESDTLFGLPIDAEDKFLFFHPNTGKRFKYPPGYEPHTARAPQPDGTIHYLTDLSEKAGFIPAINDTPPVDHDEQSSQTKSTHSDDEDSDEEDPPAGAPLETDPFRETQARDPRQDQPICFSQGEEQEWPSEDHQLLLKKQHWSVRRNSAGVLYYMLQLPADAKSGERSLPQYTYTDPTEPEMDVSLIFPVSWDLSDAHDAQDEDMPFHSPISPEQGSNQAMMDAAVKADLAVHDAYAKAPPATRGSLHSFTQTLKSGDAGPRHVLS